MVADPQILGYEREIWINRYDSDRHLRQTFRRAVHHVKPTAVIFLGDLTDEGEICNDIVFHEYHARFNRIFAMSPTMKKIYIPGDNDIDGNWPLVKPKNERFKQAFGNESKWNIGADIVIYSLNLLTNEYTSPLNDTSNTTNILISHLPVIYRPILESYTAVKAIKPTIIFSGHHHKSTEIIANASSLKYDWATPLNGMKVFDLEGLKLKGKIIEIQVPSCSYRMGTLTIGYGQAIFDNGLLKYSPIFVVSRFYQLGWYIIVLIITLFTYCVKKKKINIKYERLHSGRQ